MIRSLTAIAAALHRWDFFSRFCFIGLSSIVAACSAYGFFTEYDVWSGLTVASAGGVALAALCAAAQFCSLNMSHQARRRDGRDRLLCLFMMGVFGCWSAYGLHNFWDVVQTAASARAGLEYTPVRSLTDIDSPALAMILICTAIAFVEPVTFWVLGAKQQNVAHPAASQRQGAAHRPVSGHRLAAAAAIAMGSLGAVSMPPSVAHAETVQTAARTRAIGWEQVERAGDQLHRDGERVSLRRIAERLETSKSKIERVLQAQGVAIAARWPQTRRL